jgi:glycosyltransferase involved in cell wall biosynthesis
MFGSFAETKTKGFEYIKKAAKYLDKNEIEFVTFGSNLKVDFGINTNELGMLNNFDDLSKAYSATDVLVMPSTQETFGKVFSEAMACGTPSICFNMGGPKDVIENGKNGFLLDVGDYKGIANKIKILSKNKKMLEKLGKNAKNKISKYYTLDKEVNTYIELYKEILGENN